MSAHGRRACSATPGCAMNFGAGPKSFRPLSVRPCVTGFRSVTFTPFLYAFSPAALASVCSCRNCVQFGSDVWSRVSRLKTSASADAASTMPNASLSCSTPLRIRRDTRWPPIAIASRTTESPSV